MWQYFVQWLNQIPDVVWSGIVASVITLGGVFASNFGNTSRLIRQLNHDSSESQKERTFNLRQEAYLKAAEELVKMNSHLGKLPQIDIATVNAGDGAIDFLAVSARLQLVAEPKTALLINRLTADYAELLMKSMVRVLPLQASTNDISINDDFHKKHRTEIDRILAEMTRQNESGKPDESVFAQLNKSFDFNSEQAEHYAMARNRAAEEFQDGQQEYMRFLMPQLKKMMESQLSMMLSIREDLGLNNDQGAMEDQMRGNFSRMESQMEAIYEQIRK